MTQPIDDLVILLYIFFWNGYLRERARRLKALASMPKATQIASDVNNTLRANAFDTYLGKGSHDVAETAGL